MKSFTQLRTEVGRRVYQIEMAEGFVPATEAGERWDRYFLSVQGISHECNALDQIDRTVGTALIAMKEMGLVDYDSKM